MRAIDFKSLRRSYGSLAEYPMLLFSFSLYKGLTSMVFFLNPILPSLVPSFVGSLTSITCICFAVSITCVLFASFGRDTSHFNNPSYLYVMATALVVSVLFLGYVVPNTSLESAKLVLWLISVVLMAVGSCAIHIEFGRLMGYLGATYTLLFNIVSSVLGLLMTICLLIVPLFLRTLLGCLSIFAMVWTFLLSVKRIGRLKIYEVVDAELAIPWRFLITSLIQGVAIGLVISVFSIGLEIAPGAQLISVLVACLTAFALGIALRVDFDRLVYHTGFSAIGFGSLIFALFSHVANVQTAAVLLLFSAYVYIDIVLWSLGSHLIKNCRQPAIWVAACPSASLMLGRVIGTVVGFKGLTVGADAVNRIAIISCFAFTVSALYLSSGNNLKNGWGFIKPNDEKGLADYEWACMLIAEDFKLTSRERDVLVLLAKGKTRADVANELVVAPNTVKTHIRNIYAKLGVHSSEELARFIAHQQHAFESR